MVGEDTRRTQWIFSACCHALGQGHGTWQTRENMTMVGWILIFEVCLLQHGFFSLSWAAWRPKKNPALFDAITELWGQKLQALFADGFLACGEPWRIAIIGFTGDSPFVKKVTHSDRSFHNVRKSGFSKKDQKGCCWLCRAGFETQNESIPFEHLVCGIRCGFAPKAVTTQSHGRRRADRS